MSKARQLISFRTSILLVSISVFFISCGISQEEKDAMEKRTADSLSALEEAKNAAKAAARVKASMDSVIEAQIMDSVNAAP